MDSTTIGFAIIIMLIVLSHILQRRALARMERLVEHQSRTLETASARAAPPSSTSGRIVRPGTTALERVRPSPAASDRHARIASPRSDDKLRSDDKPRADDVPAEPTRPATSRHVPRGGEWTPTHRITFIAESGKLQSWLVAIVPAPYGHRIAVTHAEWAAGVTPAWHCAGDGSWTCHGLRTPDGVRGRMAIEDFV